jgi:hypothetical protein
MHDETSNPGRPTQRRGAHRRIAARWRSVFVALAFAGAGSACIAAESIGNLGAAFRPQGTVDASTEPKRAAPAPGSLPGLRVVVSSASRTLATIDGQIVRVGDTVNNMRVTRIDTHGVMLVGQGGAREWLKVTPAVVKSPRPAKATTPESRRGHS